MVTDEQTVEVSRRELMAAQDGGPLGEVMVLVFGFATT